MAVLLFSKILNYKTANSSPDFFIGDYIKPNRMFNFNFDKDNFSFLGKKR